MAAALKSPAPDRPVFKVDRKRQFHFLHGDDEAAIENAKRAIVEAHLTPEERDENYREIIPSGSPPTLKKVLGEVLAELSTVSFLPDARRVVTLYTVNDFFEARPAKTARAKAKAAAEAAAQKMTPSEHLARFIETELPRLPAVLIVIAIEDYEKWKRVAPKNPVVDLATQTGALRVFKEESPQFAFFDALFERDTCRALELWRAWQERTGPGSPRPYMLLASQLRLLIQAKTSTSAQIAQRGVSRQRYASEFMPLEADKSFFALRPEWRQDKMARAAANFSFGELLSAYEKLEPLQKFAIPLNSDPYVPDRNLMAELWIVEFTSREPKA